MTRTLAILFLSALVSLSAGAGPLAKQKPLEEKAPVQPGLEVWEDPSFQKEFLENGIETIIKPTDTINIFPAVGGG